MVVSESHTQRENLVRLSKVAIFYSHIDARRSECLYICMKWAGTISIREPCVDELSVKLILYRVGYTKIIS